MKTEKFRKFKNKILSLSFWQSYFFILLFLFLRFYHLNVGVLANDEAKTALGIDFPHSFLLPAIDVLSQKIFGHNEFAVRLPMAMFGVLGIWVFYLFVKKFINKEKALCGALIFALLPSNILFSRTAYLDVPLVFIWLLAVYFWFSWEKEKNKSDLFFLFLSLLLSLFFKIQAIYLFGAFFFYLILIKKMKFWKDERLYILILAFIPFFFYFLSQPQQLYDMKKYLFEMKSGHSITTFLKFIFYYYGILLFFVLGGLGGKYNNFKKFFLIFLLIILFSLRARGAEYYIVMLDIPFAYFVYVFMEEYGVFRDKRKRILAFLILFLNLFFILNSNFAFKNSFLNKNFGDWQKYNFQVNKITKGKEVVLDSDLGFGAKWYIKKEAKKLDYFLHNFGLTDTEGIAIILKENTYTNKQEYFSNFKVFKFNKIIVLLDER